MSKPTAPPPPFLSGFCSPGNPLDSHSRCLGAYDGRPCACTTEGCACRAARSAILCGPGATTGDLVAVREFAAALISDDPHTAMQQLQHQQHGNPTTLSLQEAIAVQATVTAHHATATSNGTPVEVTVTGKRWTWEADAAGTLMLEGGPCPMCNSEWDAHEFTADDKVVCW